MPDPISDLKSGAAAVRAAGAATVQDAVAAGKADMTDAEAAAQSWARRHRAIVIGIAAVLLIALGAVLATHGAP